MPRWPLRSMWNSLPCHSAWAMPCDEVQPGHLLVPDLGVEADHLGVLERGDERQRVADRRQQDVAAGLVRLGLEREPQVVAAVDDVLGQQVQALAVAVERGADVLRGRRTPRPRGRPTSRTSVAPSSAARSMLRITLRSAKRRTSRSLLVNAAVLEDRVGEQVGRHHRHDQAGLVERLAEPVDVLGAAASSLPNGIRSSSWNVTP